MCGALINAGTHSWPQLLDLLERADLEALPVRLDDYPHPSLAVALAASIDNLSLDDRDRYLGLAVFGGQGPVPVAAVQVLWGLDQQHAAALIGDLADKSLLRAEPGRVSLHDLQMDYLIRSAPDLPALHARLLVGYRDRCPGGWAAGPDDGYFYQHLAHHLHQAGRLAELKALLLDLDWMTAKLATATITGLLADYDTLPSDPALRLVADTLRLSAHVLARDLSQLPSQLTGRLASQTGPQLRQLLQRTRHWSANPWLRPLTASLTPPGGPLLRILTSHRNMEGVTAVAVSADGRRVVSGGEETVRVWDLDTGEPPHALAGLSIKANTHGLRRRVQAVAISADGRRAVSGGGDGKLRVWDLDTGELLHDLTSDDEGVNAVAISADGRRAVSGNWDEAVRVWDLETGELLHTLGGRHNAVKTVEPGAVAVSADGRRAVSGGEYRTARVWDLDTGELLYTLTGHSDTVWSVAISADGRRGVTGGGGTVQVWDLETGETLHILIGHQAGVGAVAVSADGRRAVSGSDDKTVRVWDLDTGELLNTLTRHREAVNAVAVSADGRRAVSGSKDGTVRVWDATSRQPPGQPPAGHKDWVRAVAISADGQRAVSASSHEDNTIRVWDLETGASLRTLTGHSDWVEAVAVSADGRHAVSGSHDSTVRVWDLDTGTPVHILTGHDGWVNAVAVSTDGRRAASASFDGTVRVWDLETGELVLGPLSSHGSTVNAVMVSADGRRAVAGTGDGMVEVWDLTSRKPVLTASQQLRLWLLRRSLRRGRGRLRLRQWRGVDAFAVSADGRRAVSGSEEGTVRVWNLDTGERLHSLTGHDRWVNAVAVSADGSRAVSGGHDGTVGCGT